MCANFLDVFMAKMKRENDVDRKMKSKKELHNSHLYFIIYKELEKQGKNFLGRTAAKFVSKLLHTLENNSGL